jgi:uncharacterized protein
MMFLMAKENTNVGNVRETFFVNQFKFLATIHLAEKADFLINEKYTFEVGERGKTKFQIQNTDNAYIAKDNIEIGTGNAIPVWLFGFMY